MDLIGLYWGTHRIAYGLCQPLLVAMGFGVCSHTRDHVQTFGGGGITCDQATWAPSRSTPARTCPTGQRIICNDGSFNQRATLDLHNSAQILICLITIILIYRYCNIYIYLSCVAYQRSLLILLTVRPSKTTGTRSQWDVGSPERPPGTRIKQNRGHIGQIWNHKFHSGNSAMVTPVQG